MKKFLLSIFAVMLAVFSVQAETKTYTYDFSKNTNWVTTKGGSTAVATGSSNKLNAFYDKATGDAFNAGGKGYFNNGYFLWGTSGAYIELPTYAGEKITNVTAKSSSGHSTSVTVGIYSGSTSVVSAKTWSTNSSLYSYDIPAEYQSEVLRLQVTSSGKNSQVVSITITTETTGEGGGETPEPEAPAAPTLPAACNFDNAMTVEITGIADGATAYYSLNNETDWVEGTSVEITETTTVYAKAVKDELSSDVVSATYTKNTPVTPPAEGEVVDVLNREMTGITKNSTTYSNWSDKTVSSSAVYAGQSAGGNDAIQLRSKNNNSGIVTTKSGGKAKKVAVVWQSSTSGGRTLNVYGKNTAYSAATDLYSTSTQGTLLGTIVCGTSTELVIEGDYEYIGMRSASDPMYLTSISITWDASNVVVVPDAPKLPTSGDFVTSKNIEITNFNDYEDGTTVYYSIGGEPMVYTGAFDITTTCEIVAYAEQDGKKSAEVRAEYTRIAKDPVINIVGDTNPDAFEGSIEVEIGTENGAVAYYTLNGEEPTVESTKYEGALTIKATATLKVIAVEEGEYRSKNVVDKAFTMALNDTSVDVDANSVTFDATAQGYVDKEEVASANITDGISVLFDKGTNSNTAKYYENGEAIRSYGGSYFIVKSTVGTIIKIVLTYGSGDGSNAITTDCGEFNSDTWVGNAESVKFTIGGTTGNRRIQKITVTYGEPKNENYSLIVTSAGWATLFLDYAVAIPEGVTCYTVSAVDGEYATLAEVEGVIPANTGVIVEAEEGEYVFEVTDASTEVESNMLGTTVNKYIFEDAYVLGVDEGVVGLYKAAMAGGAWLNNANKAYLPASALPTALQGAASFSFRFGEGTTGIDEITDNRVQSTVIYDLTGRRVEEVTAPGIYIVGGKKVLVK